MLAHIALAILVVFLFFAVPFGLFVGGMMLCDSLERW